MSDQNTTTFRVEFLDGRPVDMEFDTDATRSLRRTLDQATTIVACPDCGDLCPITGGIPTTMPQCARCDDPMHGVTEVTVVRKGGEDDTTHSPETEVDR
jgi:uncharacterized protein YbaR (Trm112 family)